MKQFLNIIHTLLFSVLICYSCKNSCKEEFCEDTSRTDTIEFSDFISSDSLVDSFDISILPLDNHIDALMSHVDKVEYNNGLYYFLAQEGVTIFDSIGRFIHRIPRGRAEEETIYPYDIDIYKDKLYVLDMGIYLKTFSTTGQYIDYTSLNFRASYINIINEDCFLFYENNHDRDCKYNYILQKENKTKYLHSKRGIIDMAYDYPFCFTECDTNLYLIAGYDNCVYKYSNDTIIQHTIVQNVYNINESYNNEHTLSLEDLFNVVQTKNKGISIHTFQPDLFHGKIFINIIGKGKQIIYDINKSKTYKNLLPTQYVGNYNHTLLFLLSYSDYETFKNNSTGACCDKLLKTIETANALKFEDDNYCLIKLNWK